MHIRPAKTKRADPAEAAAGHRPTRSGYAIGAGSGRPPNLVASVPHARPTARHGLIAAKTSPNTTLATGMPTQKITKTAVGARFAVAVWEPARPE